MQSGDFVSVAWLYFWESPNETFTLAIFNE